MKKSIWIVVLLFVLGVVSLVAADRFTAVKELSICGGTIPCRCGDILVKDITLTDDLLNCSEDYGLRFRDNKEDITLNCNGHTINGVRKTGSTGVYLGSGEEYTVTNCVIGGFENGVFLGSGHMHVSNNSISENVENGLLIHDTSVDSNSRVGSNHFYNNGRSGIYIVNGSTWLHIGSNAIDGNGKYGVEIEGSKFAYIYNNLFQNNFIGNAFEHNGSQTNMWNMSELGNYWDDFESNPGYPNYYEIPGPGNGVDWYPNKI